jgi:hypothetical protein
MQQQDQHEVEDLYRKAQRILLHELTPEEHAFVVQLALDNRATLSEEKLRTLKDLVRRKGHLHSA